MLSPQFSWPCSTLLPTLRPLTYRCGAKMCKILKPLLNEAFSSQLNYLNVYLIYIWLLMGWRCNHFWLNPLYLRGLWYVTRARLEECMVLRVRLPVSPRCNFKIPQEKRWKKQPSNVTRHKKEYYQPSWLSKSENLYLLQFEIGSKVLPTLLTQLPHKFVCIDKNPYGDCKYSYLSSKINLCIVFTRSKSILPFFNIHCPLFFKWSHFTKAFLYISRLCKHNLVLFSCLPNLRADNCENAALGKQ